MTRRDVLRWGGAAGLALASGLELACSDAPPVAEPEGQLSNILIVMCDDMRADLVDYMPQTLAAFDDGRRFTSCRLNVNLCQPARCGFLTGQWALRAGNGVYDNGGYVPNPRNTIAPWMSSAGYHNAVVGKYPMPFGATPLEGWDFQRTLTSESDQRATGYVVFDGTSTTQPEEHQTDYLASEVRNFIRSAPEPWFCWMTPTDPHVNGQLRLEPRPQDADAWADVVWDIPEYDDMSTKPSWMQALPVLTPQIRANIQASARRQLQELNAVDDAVGSILELLRQVGQLDRTFVVFTSDNGVMYGEQRIWGGYSPSDKNVPYDPAMRVPLLVRGPGVRAGTIEQPVCGQDLTAMCVAVASAKPTLELDGVDLREVISRPRDHDDRALLHERTSAVNPVPGMPSGRGVTTATRKLWRHDGESTPADEFELYLLDEDPNELVNVANDPDHRAEREELEERLGILLDS